MGFFVTAKSRLEQTDEPGYWRLIDNELYMDDDGKLIITPRYLWSDGYTFPNFLLPFTGDKHRLDVRPANGHDLCCRFHERIVVNLSLAQLRLKGFLKYHKEKDILVCDDIPEEYLQIQKISKNDTDNMLYRMMKACNISPMTRNIIRFGVIFNVNWWIKTGKSSLTRYNIFKEDIGLVNGV